MSHDMSAGIVKLDLDEMIDVAIHAVRNARNMMSKYQSEIDNAIYTEYSDGDAEYHRNHHCQFWAQYLAKAASDYAKAWSTYHALTEAKKREVVEVVK
jgi:hypothetical protein